MRERDVERALVKAVKDRGGMIRKLSWIGRNGAPDRLVKLPEHAAPIFVELKAPDGKLSRIQRHEITKMISIGLTVKVVWRVEQIEGALA